MCEQRERWCDKRVPCCCHAGRRHSARHVSSLPDRMKEARNEWCTCSEQTAGTWPQACIPIQHVHLRF